MLLSRIFDKLANLSSPEFAVSRDLTRIEIHYAKLIGDFVIKRTIIAPDLSFSTVLEVKQQNINLVITPDSLFPGDMKSLEYHQIEIWRILLNQRTCAIHLGSEWYTSNNGFAIALINQLGLDAVDLLTIQDPNLNQKIPVGRIASFKHPFQDSLSTFLKKFLPEPGIVFTQDANNPISNVAIIPIENITSSIIYHVIEFGCQAIVGGDFSANAVQAIKATGISAYSLKKATIFEIGLKYLTKLLAVEYPNEEFSYFAPTS